MELDFKIVLVYTFAYKAKDLRGVVVDNLGGQV